MKNNIYFISFGKGKTTLIFLHGWQHNGKSFLSLIPHLYRKYTIYMLDMPGFGKSQFNPSLRNSCHYADLIYLWIKRRKISNVVLIGHSFGGKVASLVASRSPQLLKGLILISSSGIPHPRFYYPFLPFLKKVSFFRKFRELLLSRDYKEAGVMLPVFKNIVKEDLRSDFTKIEIPTLILWGEKDKELPVKDAYLINSLIRNSSVKVIKNAGHFPFIDNPQKVAYLIDSFVKKL